jgi:hypothetical protein
MNYDEEPTVQALEAMVADWLERPDQPNDGEWKGDDFRDCRLLKIFPDHGPSYIWQGDVSTDIIDFGGSEALNEQLYAWAEEWTKLDELHLLSGEMLHYGSVSPDWELKGLKLAIELRRVLPSQYELWYCSLEGDAVRVRTTPRSSFIS